MKKASFGKDSKKQKPQNQAPDNLSPGASPQFLNDHRSQKYMTAYEKAFLAPGGSLLGPYTNLPGTWQIPRTAVVPLLLHMQMLTNKWAFS